MKSKEKVGNTFVRAKFPCILKEDRMDFHICRKEMYSMCLQEQAECCGLIDEHEFEHGDAFV